MTGKGAALALAPVYRLTRSRNGASSLLHCNALSATKTAFLPVLRRESTPPLSKLSTKLEGDVDLVNVRELCSDVAVHSLRHREQFKSQPLAMG